MGVCVWVYGLERENGRYEKIFGLENVNVWSVVMFIIIMSSSNMQHLAKGRERWALEPPPWSHTHIYTVPYIYIHIYYVLLVKHRYLTGYRVFYLAF